MRALKTLHIKMICPRLPRWLSEAGGLLTVRSNAGATTSRATAAEANGTLLYKHGFCIVTVCFHIFHKENTTEPTILKVSQCAVFTAQMHPLCV